MEVEPLVACVMITNNRPQMAGRAVRHFNRQTYKNKLLFVFDSSFINPCQAATVWDQNFDGASIGQLRNRANQLAFEQLQPDILINWDDDDVSRPNRIASQVAQLTWNGNGNAPAVGYHNLLWWDSTKTEAWLYENGSRHYTLGTSLCYWAETWKRHPFPDSNLGEWKEAAVGQCGFSSFVNGEPMIIGEWHGKNGANAGNTPSREPWKIGGECWKRMPEWDERLNKKMAL